VRGGAYLVEEVLHEGDGEFSYRAYDVPSRCPVIVHEFFPVGARREELEVRAPSGWTAQGFDIAKAKWLQRHGEALAIFEENGTAYLVMDADSPPVRLQAEYSAPANPVFHSTPAAVSVPIAPIQSASPRRLSLADLWPDAFRGAVQGGLLCGVSGVLLGALAAAFGEGDFLSGALLGAWAFPIGALCGALLGVLRALPSNAPTLASASSLSPEQQLRSTLLGAGKGGVLGLVSGGALILAAFVSGNEVSVSSALRGVLLFALAGAIGGAVVGFIRINPRDRSRRS
jgi:hypothetical protein